MIRRRLPALLLALLLPLGAAAQDDAAPKVEVTVDPPDAVTVGTPVAVDVTVLVPTYMPQPPVWPDLQIADAVTRLPARATHPVTRRIGAASWSGVTRRYEIIPQRPADFELSGATVTVTFADPQDNAPRELTAPLPKSSSAPACRRGRRTSTPSSRRRRSRSPPRWTACPRRRSRGTASR